MKKIIVLFAGITLITGCTKQSNPVTNFIYTHSDSALVGDMIGYVNLYDSVYNNWINYITNIGTGVAVSLDGTPFKTITDSTGKWTLKDVPAGTYTITFTKPGFAKSKILSYKFVGNGTDFIGKENLYQVATLHPTLVIRPFQDGVEAVFKDTIYIYPNGDSVTFRVADSVLVPLSRAIFTGHYQEESNPGQMYIVMSLFLSKTQHPDPLDPNSYLYKLDNGSNFTVYRDSLYAKGFKSGDQIFCMAAAETYQCRYEAYYLDFNTDKYIYTGFSPIYSEVKNFILP